jgi:hypothetical protein
MLNTVATNVSTNVDNVWYVDSGVSNHMTYHGEWFTDVKNLEKPSYIEMGDHTAHPIAHIENVPLVMQDGKIKYLSDVFHVPNITKNLVFVGQMIEQGLQVRFNMMAIMSKISRTKIIKLLRAKEWVECLLWM